MHPARCGVLAEDHVVDESRCTNDGSKCEQPKPLSSLSVNVNDAITLTEIADENIVNIVNLKYTDQECNVLAWKCLGYQYNKQLDAFQLSNNVFPKWASKYPDPPDLIGITRRYDPDTDKVVRNASMDLMRSIPRSFKGGVRGLVSVGFKGYKLNELTPPSSSSLQLHVRWYLRCFDLVLLHCVVFYTALKRIGTPFIVFIHRRC